MRYPAILAGSLGLAALAVLPAAAQQAPPPLAYVQPLPGSVGADCAGQAAPGRRLYRSY